MLKIHMKPYSLNKAFYKNRTLTQATRKYREEFLLCLQSDYNKNYLDAISKAFNPSKHALSVSFIFYSPKEIFFTKQGQVSNRSQDLDNCLKLPIDFICNKKYQDRVLQGVKISNLGIDDRYIIDIQAKKRASLNGEYLILVEFSILDLQG